MKNVKKILAILLALLLVLPVFSLTVVATSIGSMDTSDESLTTPLQRKEAIALEKYNQLLLYWAYDKKFPNDEYANFPSFYGGAYIDENKNLVIQLTDINDSNIAYFKELIDLDDVIFGEVEYSFATLIAEKDAAAENVVELNNNFADVITAVGISVAKNAINLYVYEQDVEKYGINVQAMCNEITTFDNINIVQTKGKDEPCSTVYPGSEIQFTGGNRSIGFWAYNSNGDLGIITAPHASVAQNDIAKINGVTFGQASVPYFSGSVDAVFVKCTNLSAFSPSRYVSGHNVSHSSGNYLMLTEGASVYSRGKSSSAKTGVVEDLSYTVTYTGGVRLTSCALTSITAQDGDSGGIVIGIGSGSNRYVVGIITGRRTSDNHMIYVKAGLLLSRLNCTVY